MAYYAYVRTSTKKQSCTRQIENAKRFKEDVVIIVDKCSGATMERPNWLKLEKTVKPGDYIIFDEISRMSRNADEGYATYKSLYDKGINLIFLKERTLDTENFRETAQVALTGESVDVILEGVNKYLMILAETQIKSAFACAQHELDFLHKRTAEGVRRAQVEGKRIGIEKGRVLHTTKEKEMMPQLRKYSRDFDGTLNDIDTMRMLNLSRNTYYKYKKMLLNM